MRILLWHVHGGWTDGFVRGDHDYLLPTNPQRDRWGLGRGGRDWPAGAIEVDASTLTEYDVDLVVLQRPEDLAAAEGLLGVRLGRDLPAIYVEHNTPKGDVPSARHPLADRSDILVVHVTHFNRLMWDTGDARVTVVEHGVRDPGLLYTGELPRLGVVINEPVRRGRVTGTDLLPAFSRAAPIDVFGMGTAGLHEAVGLAPEAIAEIGDLPTALLHEELARRRVYVHPLRWTSLGLSLLEAMHLGMPVVALATTEAARAVPPEAGAVSTDIDQLVFAARRLIDDPGEARARGLAARQFALAHYGLPRFLARWDSVLADEASRSIHRSSLRPPDSSSPDIGSSSSTSPEGAHP